MISTMASIAYCRELKQRHLVIAHWLRAPPTSPVFNWGPMTAILLIRESKNRLAAETFPLFSELEYSGLLHCFGWSITRRNRRAQQVKPLAHELRGKHRCPQVVFPPRRGNA